MDIITNPKVDKFIENTEKWQKEFKALRKIILDCHLKEELKWGVPCYTFNGKNVVLIHGFKEYCAILFIKGALLKDPSGILIQQTEKVQAGRQIRFAKVSEILDKEIVIKEYINEAVEIENAGLEVEFKKTDEYDMPEELAARLDNDQALRTAFEALTPGRQRAYIYYISSAKQSKTREARIDKYIEKILEGKGIDD